VQEPVLSQARWVDRTSVVPLYAQIEAIVRARIARGEWRVDEQIPTETEFCATYNVSRVTVRNALANLTDEGLLSRGRGKGTFVRDARLTAAARSVSSFSAELTNLGMKPGSRVLGMDMVPASDAVAEKMMIEPGTMLWHLRRLRTADDSPIGIQTALILANRCPGLDRLMKDDVSLYEVLKRDFGLAPLRAIEVFKVAGVPRSQSTLLRVAKGSHAFVVTRVTFEERGAFEYTTSILRGDRYQLSVVLQNPK
jgi:GntR family transcriptional regulator